MSTEVEESPARPLACTPSSTTSGCLSGDDTSEDRLLPSSLAMEELQLAVNKEATEDELQKAITRCKELVLECNQCSPERKWLVRHLIELRLRLQECREALQDPEHPRNKSGIANRTVRGHHFLLQPLLRSTAARYCDHCTGAIWSVVQAWYICEDCGYACHHKCLSSIVRECAHVTASEKGGFELNICPEQGLSSQKYRCAECKASLPLDSIWSEARKCDYTGFYYCSACHWSSSAVIPARVIHNWDFEPQPVCQASLQLLKITANRPLINIERLNPRLFSLVQELGLVRRIRNELAAMRRYLLVCRKAADDHLLWKNVDLPHLIESPDLYSLQDLCDTLSAELPTKLHKISHVFSQHIKELCEVCKGRGHICELCVKEDETEDKIPEVLFPFDSHVMVCKDCGSVFHETCFNKRKKCPKCFRLRQRKIKEDFADEEI